MTKQFLVVFEAAETGYGAFAPDIPGCYGLGKTLDETRQRFFEAANAHLAWMAKDHDPMPNPVTSSFDFAREPGDGTTQYVVEWLPIDIPVRNPVALSA